MGNALRFLRGNCGKPAVEEEQAGNESLGHRGVTADTVGVSALAHDLFHFEITSQVPDGLNQHVGPSRKAQAKWYLVIGDVRGRGLMIGVELVHDRQLKNPAKKETLHVMDQMKGVLIGKGGFYGNVFRITPPLCSTKQDADFLADALDYTLSKI